MRVMRRGDFFVICFVSILSAFYIYPPFWKEVSKHTQSTYKISLKSTPLNEDIDNDE